MKANELRHGNLILQLDGNLICCVEGLPNDNFIQYSYPENPSHHKSVFGEPIEYFKGVPLTEDWLLKFGFKKCDVRFTSLFTIDCDKFNNGILEIYRHEGEGLEFSVRTNNKIKIEFHFVHQLQNLYFALTEEELEIK